MLYFNSTNGLLYSILPIFDKARSGKLGSKLSHLSVTCPKYLRYLFSSYYAKFSYNE